MDLSLRNSILILSVLLILTINSACSNAKSNTDTISQYSKKYIGQESYNHLRQSINDSLNIYSLRGLKTYSAFYCDSWRLDDIITINSEKNKIITTANFYKREGCSNNKLVFIYGVLIEKKWYFFRGGTQYLLGDEALCFEELHDLAVEHVYRGYLKRGSGGEYEINDAFFSDLTSTAWWLDGVEPKSQKEWNNIYERIVRENWERRDTTDWERVRREEKLKRKRI
jgi:hypothetical protein